MCMASENEAHLLPPGKFLKGFRGMRQHKCTCIVWNTVKAGSQVRVSEVWVVRPHKPERGVTTAKTHALVDEDSGPALAAQFNWPKGMSFDPSGNLLHRAAHDQEALVLVDCDLDQIDATRTHWPFLRDRRIDAYGDLTKRFLGR